MYIKVRCQRTVWILLSSNIKESLITSACFQIRIPYMQSCFCFSFYVFVKYIQSITGTHIWIQSWRYVIPTFIIFSLLLLLSFFFLFMTNVFFVINTALKIKFCIKDFYSKCNQILNGKVLLLCNGRSQSIDYFTQKRLPWNSYSGK